MLSQQNWSTDIYILNDSQKYFELVAIINWLFLFIGINILFHDVIYFIFHKTIMSVLFV